MSRNKSDTTPVPHPEAGGGHAPKLGEGPAEGTEKGGDKAASQAPKRPDPTRYGDWEKNGRCIDF